MTKLHELYDSENQSPWLDNLRRDYLTNGHLASLISKGVRGLTSNPTIMAKAIEGEDAYDHQLASMKGDAESAYWELVIDDIVHALELFRPLHDESGGSDGFVSVEVSPSLAHDTAGTVAAARRLHERIGAPNLLVKIPATKEGVPAVRQMIAEGRSVNVTLIFSLERYSEVMDAYLAGLEELQASGGELSRVASVASFFVSRVDTEVDRRLEAGAASKELMGRAAVSQAKLAYREFTERFSGGRFNSLSRSGARVQRPLWASTSTKNPAYPDLLYVENLIGPDTVNTMPDDTLDAFLDHGSVARTVDLDVTSATRHLEAISRAGIDMKDVTRQLEDEGVAAFQKSFDELLDQLTSKLAAR